MIGEKYFYVNEGGAVHDNTDYDCRTEWFMSAMGNMFDSKEEAIEKAKEMKKLWEALKTRRTKLIPFTNDDTVRELLKQAEQFTEGLS